MTDKKPDDGSAVDGIIDTAERLLDKAENELDYRLKLMTLNCAIHDLTEALSRMGFWSFFTDAGYEDEYSSMKERMKSVNKCWENLQKVYSQFEEFTEGRKKR